MGMKMELTETQLRNMYQKLYDLAILSEKMHTQHKLFNKVVEHIFGEELSHTILTNEEMVDGIIAYFSNGEIYNFNQFKRNFKQVLVQEKIKFKEVMSADDDDLGRIAHLKTELTLLKDIMPRIKKKMDE